MRITNYINHIRNHWEYYAAGTAISALAWNILKPKPKPVDPEIKKAIDLSKVQAEYDAIIRKIDTLLRKTPKERLAGLTELRNELAPLTWPKLAQELKSAREVVDALIVQIEQAHSNFRKTKEQLSSVDVMDKPEDALQKVNLAASLLRRIPQEDLTKSKVAQVDDMRKKLEQLKSWFGEMLKQIDPHAKQFNAMVKDLKKKGWIGSPTAHVETPSNGNCLFISMERLMNHTYGTSHSGTGATLRARIVKALPKLQGDDHKLAGMIDGELKAIQEGDAIGYPKKITEEPKIDLQTYIKYMKMAGTFGGLTEVRAAVLLFKIPIHVHLIDQTGKPAIAKFGNFNKTPLELIGGNRHYQPYFPKTQS